MDSNEFPWVPLSSLEFPSVRLSSLEFPWVLLNSLEFPSSTTCSNKFRKVPLRVLFKFPCLFSPPSAPFLTQVREKLMWNKGVLRLVSLFFLFFFNMLFSTSAFILNLFEYFFSFISLVWQIEPFFKLDLYIIALSFQTQVSNFYQNFLSKRNMWKYAESRHACCESNNYRGTYLLDRRYELT